MTVDTLVLTAGLLGCGAVLLAGGVRALARRAREARYGHLVRVETDTPALLRSERYRLAGRPDELRATRDGAVVPVELKHRGHPARGAFYSHTVQVWAYCLLVEEETGRPPPYGVVRYLDGEEVVPWNGAARAALLDVLRRARAPYDGRADPSPGKCSRCPWTARCDASAARTGPTGRSLGAPSTAR